MKPDETGRFIPPEPEQHAHHGADGHRAEFNEHQAMRPDKLAVDTHRSLFLNPGHQCGIVGTACQAFSQAIVEPAGWQHLCHLCLPQDVPVCVMNRSFAIGGHHQVGELRKRVFCPGPLMRGEERLRELTGLGLENRQLKRYQRVFRNSRQFLIPFNLVRPFSLVVARGPGKELLFPLGRALESFLHIPGPTNHQTERLLGRLELIQLGCRCRQPCKRRQSHYEEERRQQRNPGREPPRIDPNRRRRVCGSPPGLRLLRLVERNSG
ncbi:MAG: hypothetical protein EWM73_01226 [Nitrospira sp.]|nr:MAG: hypothetical protein EWM73_01226 [Nitrospira sp.]